MNEEFPNLGEQIEPIPTAEQVLEVIERLIGKECKEKRRIEDNLGLYILEIETPGTGPGDIDEYEYRRKKSFAENDQTETEICVTYYLEGVPTAGQDVGKYINGKWVISMELYQGVSLETLQALHLDEIGHDISLANSEVRKALFDRLAVEKDEKWASEALEINQALSVEEQELLVSHISDSNLSMEVLTLAKVNGREFTQPQKEKLMSQVESDEDVSFTFYINLVESGEILEPTVAEKWWIERLETTLSQSSNPEITTYLSEHSTSL